ncbi:PilZ domain-containing protein [Desulforhopalus singaporensis]|uniref:PilZ domain-containing protein n=1 Tax=Desulforhopalus singaporensis TaxID=91360 RepID=A0A1H0LWR5_9BACT|nr:PilZ domain-containing protein [Desulforhopalus singaporensis]SDO72585.1 PilZ domain-containing protein [Desulforhopalus singaporensis]
MADTKKNWDDISSLDDLKIDWDFEPENPQGKRKDSRLTVKELGLLLEKKNIPVKVLALKNEHKGKLVDLSLKGAALLLDIDIPADTKIALGFFLGAEKILTRGVVKNCSPASGGHRIGLMFSDLPAECQKAIDALLASKNYRL